jgi:hypothetical protein
MVSFTIVSEFLSKPCFCGKNCQAQFSFNEIFHSRADFGLLTKHEKNCLILLKNKVFKRFSSKVKSVRLHKARERQKFEYHINIDRAVCRNVCIDYYGETLSMLKYLQKHLMKKGISMPIHGNTGRIPKNALSSDDKSAIGSFIVNFAVAHGMPE